MSSYYRRLLREAARIDRIASERDACPPATYMPSATPASSPAALAKASAAAISKVAAHVGRYTPYLPLPRRARRMTPEGRRRQFGAFMAKCQAAYQDGTITADQLAALEARRHHVVDALASRGAI